MKYTKLIIITVFVAVLCLVVFKNPVALNAETPTKVETTTISGRDGATIKAEVAQRAR